MDYIQLEKLYNLGRVPGLRTFHKVGAKAGLGGLGHSPGRSGGGSSWGRLVVLPKARDSVSYI